MKTHFAKRFAALPLALPFALILAGCDSEPATDLAPSQVELDHNQQRFELTQALSDNPGDQDVRLRLAQTQLMLGDGVGAQSTLDAMSDAGLAGGEAAALMGHAALLQERPEQALEWAQKAGADNALGAWVETGALLSHGQTAAARTRIDAALQDHPGDARLLALSGEMALGRGEIEPARDLADRALAADGQSLQALMLAGRVSVLSQDWDEAQKHYGEAARQHGGVIGPLLALAATQADAGNVEGAQETLVRLRQLAPNHPLGLFFEAKLAFLQGDLETAHGTLQQGEGDLRKVPAAQLLRGEIAHLRGNQEAASSALIPFMRDNPLHLQGAMVLAQSYVATGDKAKALAVIEAPAAQAAAGPELLALASRLAQDVGGTNPYAARVAENAPPEDAPARLVAADRAIDGGDYQTAYETYAGLVDDGMGSNAMVLNNGALMALNVGNSADALGFARRAHALTPDDPAVINTLGWVLLETDENKGEALTLLRRAHELRPGNLEFRWHYAAALAANGRKGEARAMAMSVREFAGPAQRETIDALLEQL